MKIIRDSVYRIPKELISDEELNKFLINNPNAFFDKDAPPLVSYIFKQGNNYILPRNYPIDSLNLDCAIENRIYRGNKIKEFDFKSISPFDYQLSASIFSSNHEIDHINEAPCGSGKTIIGLDIIRRIGRKAFIIVPTTQLQDQWIFTIDTKTTATAQVFNSKKLKFDADIIVANVQAIYDFNKSVEEFTKIGVLLLDEVHMMAALRWSRAAALIPAYRRIGLSATPKRGDSFDEILSYSFGSVDYVTTHKQMLESGNVLLPDIMAINIPYDDSFVYKVEPNSIIDPFYYDLNEVKTLNNMAISKKRNNRILYDVKQCLKAGRKILVLVCRKEQIEYLGNIFKQNNIDYGVIQGCPSRKKRKQLYDENIKKPVIIAMQQLAKMGLDDPDIDTIIFPFFWSKSIMTKQASGRPTRVKRDEKGNLVNKNTPLIIDYVDVKNNKLIKKYKKRYKVYVEMGCKFR